MSDLMTRLRYYRCGDKECAEIAARAASEIERLKGLLDKLSELAEQRGDEIERLHGIIRIRALKD